MVAATLATSCSHGFPFYWSVSSSSVWHHSSLLLPPTGGTRPTALAPASSVLKRVPSWSSSFCFGALLWSWPLRSSRDLGFLQTGSELLRLFLLCLEKPLKRVKFFNSYFPLPPEVSPKRFFKAGSSQRRESMGWSLCWISSVAFWSSTYNSTRV